MDSVTPNFDQTYVAPKREPKEMLSAQKVEGKWWVRINYSSLSMIQDCMRKAYYGLHRRLVHADSSPALVMGSAVHKAMEIWYCSAIEERTKITNADRDIIHEALAAAERGEDPMAQSWTGASISSRVGAVIGFLSKALPLRALPDTGARTLENGVAILNNYFNEYLGDRWAVLKDEHGPVLERKVEAQLVDDKNINIVAFGTIDAVMHDTTTGRVCVVDHKTTKSLGTDFLNRLKPNWQYCTYTWLANTALGLKVNEFMVNGIQVAKTVRKVNRQFVTFDTWDFQEMKAAILDAVLAYITSLNVIKGQEKPELFFPMSAPNPCTMWGGCEYLDVCNTSPELRENLLQNLFVKRENHAANS